MNLRGPFLVLLSVGLAMTVAQGQTISSHTTIRHHREVEDSDHAAEIAQAEAAMAKKDNAAAQKILLEVTAKDPNNYRAWFDLGFIDNAEGRQAQAIEDYRKSVAANPQIFESNLNLGIMLAREHDPEAETFLRAATKLKPSGHQEQGWYRAWVMLGHVLEASKPEEALEAYENAAKLNPTEPEPHFSAAQLLEKQKQYKQAAAEYQKAAELDPKSTEALAGLVNAYSESGQATEAEAPLRKFIALQPNNATAHIQLGRVLASRQKWQEAAAELEQGLKIQPGDMEAEKQLASIYLQQKQFDAAAAHVEVALKAAPADGQLHYWLGQALMNQKKFPEAEKEFLTAVKLKPDLGEAYGDLAFAASANKNYVLAIKALEARSKFLPEVPMTYFLRATAFDHLHDAKNASENYHKFLEVSNGKFPDQEWQAKHRLIAIEPKK